MHRQALADDVVDGKRGEKPFLHTLILQHLIVADVILVSILFVTLDIDAEHLLYGILVPVCIEDEKDSYTGKPSKEEILMADAMRKILEDPALVRYYRKASLERAEQLDNRFVREQWAGIIEE